MTEKEKMLSGKDWLHSVLRRVLGLQCPPHKKCMPGYLYIGLWTAESLVSSLWGWKRHRVRKVKALSSVWRRQQRAGLQVQCRANAQKFGYRISHPQAWTGCVPGRSFRILQSLSRAGREIHTKHGCPCFVPCFAFFSGPGFKEKPRQSHWIPFQKPAGFIHHLLRITCYPSLHLEYMDSV